MSSRSGLRKRAAKAGVFHPRAASTLAVAGWIRSSSANTKVRIEIAEEIDEGIEFIGRYLTTKGLYNSPITTMNMFWAMIENGGLVTPVAAQVLANLGRFSSPQVYNRETLFELPRECFGQPTATFHHAKVSEGHHRSNSCLVSMP